MKGRPGKQNRQKKAIERLEAEIEHLEFIFREGRVWVQGKLAKKQILLRLTQENLERKNP